jgi:GT2 family glycosyltransferase
MTPSPIALFVYNRPHHTRKTLESLMVNAEFSDSLLYVFCDGAKRKKDIPLVQATRELIRSYELDNATIIEREENMGLANSIITGVTELCNKYGRVIVVEDDLYLSPYFLKYMNTALDTYEEYDKVMHISGYMFPVRGQLPVTFFYRATSCWGWGTWKRAWDKFEPEVPTLLAGFKNRKKRREFDIQGSMKYYRMLILQAIGMSDSWAIRWYASVFLNNGLCLHPGKSLVNNIGHDDSGVHSDCTNVYDVDVSEEEDLEFTTDISESEKAVMLMVDFYQSIRKPIYVLVYDKIKQVIKGSFK